MTEFEKFKEQLTLENFIKNFLEFVPCRKCPAVEHCGNCSLSSKCKLVFLEWGMQEVEDEKESD